MAGTEIAPRITAKVRPIPLAFYRLARHSNTDGST